MLAVVLPLAVLSIGVGSHLVRRQERAAGHRWAISELTIQEAARQAPRTVESQAARAIAAAATRMGIPLEAPPGGMESKQYVPAELVGFVDTEIERGDDDVANEPPPEALAFLSRHADDIRLLWSLSQGDITWRSDIALLDVAPLPHYEGHRALQNVLASDALSRLRSGDLPGAMASIETAWRINAAQRKRTEPISQIVARRGDQSVTGVLRKLPPRAATSWGERVGEHDYRGSMVRSFQVYAWMLAGVARRGDPLALAEFNVGPMPHTLPLIAEPILGETYTRLMASGYAVSLDGVVSDLAASDVCKLDDVAAAQIAATRAGTWNPFTKRDVPGIIRVFQHATRRALDAELTRIILTSDTLSGSGILASSVCPGLDWRYEVTGGETSVRASYIPPGVGALGLPLRFVGRRKGASLP